MWLFSCIEMTTIIKNLQMLELQKLLLENKETDQQQLLSYVSSMS